MKFVVDNNKPCGNNIKYVKLKSNNPHNRKTNSLKIQFNISQVYLAFVFAVYLFCISPSLFKFCANFAIFHILFQLTKTPCITENGQRQEQQQQQLRQNDKKNRYKA